MQETQYEKCWNSPEGSRLELALEDQCETALFTASFFCGFAALREIRRA
ncbi:MAG: hypothetical protein ACP5IL_04095 [Syntrophobacteraceae bacterium]